MENVNEEKINIFHSIVGVIFLIFILYIIFLFIKPYPTLKIAFYFLMGLLFLIAFIVAYRCIKNNEFKIKTFNFLRKAFAIISTLGFNVIKNINSKEKSEKNKQRIPISPELKRKLFQRAENRCQYCGKGDVKLHIHHIDKNPTNNSMNNLIVLCPNHHSIAESLNVSDLRSMVNNPYRIKTTVQKVD